MAHPNRNTDNKMAAVWAFGRPPSNNAAVKATPNATAQTVIPTIVAMLRPASMPAARLTHSGTNG